MVEKYTKNQKFFVFIAYIAGYFGLQILLLGIYMAANGMYGNITPEDLIMPSMYIQLLSAFVSLIAMYMITKNVFDNDFKGFRKVKSPWLLIFGGFAAMYVANIVLGLIYQDLGIVGDSENQIVLEQMISMNPILMILPVAILIPIVEEVLFRGVILEFIEKRLGLIAAGLLSALMFALLHVTDAASLIFLPIYWVLGLILTYIYIKSGKNLLVPIVAHILNNAISIIAVLILNGGL